MIGARAGCDRSWCRFSVCVCSATSPITLSAVNAASRHAIDLIERSRILEPQIKRLEAARVRLERDVRLLDAGDPDIVEELAIQVLGFARPGDRVIVPIGEVPASAGKSAPLR